MNRRLEMIEKEKLVLLIIMVYSHEKETLKKENL